MTNVTNPLNKTKEFFKGWTTFEKTWIALFGVVITALWLIGDNSWIGAVSTYTGMLAVVLVAKGRISNFGFGLINVVTYGYIALGYGLYGEVMLNWIFYTTANIIGFFIWTKHKKNKTEVVNGEDIKVKRLTLKGWGSTILVIAVTAFLYAEVLTTINAQQVRIDSLAVVVAVVAQILMTLRYAEQWILWIAVNVLSITLWVVTLTQTGGNDWTMVAMWTAYLINSVYGYINWLRIGKTKEL